uniref:Uncharacterized protein n=1 Tax=Arundo donax TaxID=35708 RepID=A0A0A9BW61_ARUDO
MALAMSAGSDVQSLPCARRLQAAIVGKEPP